MERREEFVVVVVVVVVDDVGLVDRGRCFCVGGYGNGGVGWRGERSLLL